MIIIINGSLGVGKSSISEELLWKFNNSVMLDGDELGNVNPFNIYDEKRINHLYKTFEILVNFHIQSGYNNIIINYVFENSESLSQFSQLLSPIDKNIFVYWITCRKDVQEKRIINRNRKEINWEINRFQELQDIQRKASISGFIGIEIDSTNQTVSEIADYIVDQIQNK